MNQIYAVQNRRVALTLYEQLDRSRTWRGQKQAIPAVRFELTPKIEHEPGRYSLNRAATLGHNLALDKARLLFFDLAHGNFNEDYRVIFRNDNGHRVNKAGGYRAGDELRSRPARVVLEIWEGPGAFDRQANWAYPLNKEEPALAISLASIWPKPGRWPWPPLISFTVKLLQAWGVIAEPAAATAGVGVKCVRRKKFDTTPWLCYTFVYGYSNPAGNHSSTYPIRPLSAGSRSYHRVAGSRRHGNGLIV
jgi:hypothetical protein